ncbi:MAG: sugar phosphate isomerase/epimerase family protein [Phycisphaerales bacterium]|nr:sugar phosphate isomerase/epimerase family protein [Phycisphaerales bacterium]
MFIGYNTNGFAHHRLEDAIAILTEIGYASVALTVEHDLLDPPDRGGVERAAARLQPIIESAGIRVTLETGARFILDPRRKHQPTLVSADPSDRAKRIEFIKACIDLAAAVGADSVSLWSGAPDPESEPQEQARGHETGRLRSRFGSSAPPDANESVLFDRLAMSLRELLDHARLANVRLSFEPEPGMLIDTIAKFAALERALDDPFFGLTLDVGHIHCLGDGVAAEHILRWREKLWNVHIEDMRRGIHEHLMFGDGDMDFPPIFAALREIDYAGPVHVELSRHSHNAVEAARQAFVVLGLSC